MTNAAPTVLVVDDNEIKRYTTRRTLEASGLIVAEAATGEDALIYVNDAVTRPRVVVLDIKLPGINGIEVCRRIKANEETASVLVIHMSAHLTSSQDQAAGLEAGADAYMPIPADSKVLTATVRAMLRLSEAEDAARSLAVHWRETFDAISDAICLVDANGRVVRCNRAAAALLCDSSDTVLHAFFPDLLKRTGIHTQFSILPPTSVEVQAEDGRWYSIATHPLGSDNAQNGHSIQGAVCILSEVSERKRLEAHLNAAYEREKRIADVFQQVLLTPTVDHSFTGLEIEPIYVSAWAESLVGGDLYDVFAIGSDAVALVVADASGKGLAAATRTAEVKYALRAFLWEGTTPPNALRRLNNFVCTSQSDTMYPGFVTCALAVIYPATGVFELCSAGAEVPLLVRANGEALPLEVGGLPLGVMPGADFESITGNLSANDTLLLVTDGITEARQGPQLWGYDNMVLCVREALHNTPDLREAGEQLLNKARAFAGGALQDDACLLFARRGS